ncbi:MAG TPA: hypothetical protein VHE59_10310 [Mucilaginibacter sp.]|nr:hypothetical protein [Mucilaginibacter sp.]
MKKLYPLFLVMCVASLSRSQGLTDSARQAVSQLPFTLNLPKNEWHLAVNEAPRHYIFKRNPVIDSTGRQIIPAIMVYVEDASGFQQNVSIFCSKHMQPLIDNGVTTNRMLIQDDKDYPLTYRNAIFVDGKYTSRGIEHVIYLIYIIDKHNNGIQVYLDMTKEVAGVYGHEFWEVIHSIKEKD